MDKFKELIRITVSLVRYVEKTNDEQLPYHDFSGLHSKLEIQ